MFERFFFMHAHKTQPITITSADRGLPHCPPWTHSTHIPWVWTDACLPDCRHMVGGVCLRFLVPRRQAHHSHVPGGSAYHTTHTTSPIADNNNNWRRLLITVVLQEGFAVLQLRRHRQMSPIVVVVAMAVVVAAARFGHDRNGGNETTITTTMSMLLFRIHRERKNCCGAHKTLWEGRRQQQCEGRGACPSSTFAFTFRRFVCCGFVVLFVIFTLFCFHSFLSFANWFQLVVVVFLVDNLLFLLSF